jgi:hypothetical protein
MEVAIIFLILFGNGVFGFVQERRDLLCLVLVARERLDAFGAVRELVEPHLSYQ